ncbi:MAG: EAL domain-containing protein [Pseudomonadota bacterium]
MTLRLELGRRFLALTLVGYILAVGAAVLAVHFASQPILRGMQHKALVDHARSNARDVELRLAQTARTLESIARSPEILAIATGEANPPGRLGTLLSSFEIEAGVRRIAVFDREGAMRAAQNLGPPTPQLFFPVEVTVEATAAISGTAGDLSYVYRPGGPAGHARFLITAPIRRQGTVKGALVFEKDVDLSEIIDRQTSIGSQRLATRFQAQMAHLWQPEDAATTMTPIPRTDFFLVLEPDQATLRAIGREIVSKVMIAVGLVLIVPFGLMCAAGYHAIVAPHKALAASREELRRNQAELHELAQIARRSNHAILVTDIEGCIIWANPAFAEVTGYSVEQVIGKRPGDMLQGPDTDPEERARISAAIRNREPVHSEILNYRENGEPYWIALAISPLLDDAGDVYRFVAISSDITASRAQRDAILTAKREIEFQALHDPLTGLPNRRRLDVELEALSGTETAARTLIRIDLDHFKYVNDTLGHAAGDFVLIEVSRILTRLTGPGDLAARVGGDEFVILLAPGRSRSDAEALAKLCLREIRHDMVFEGRICRVGASFGIASAADGIVGNTDLLLAADAALYMAKDQGRNTVATYSERMHKEVIEKRVLAAEIEAAIDREEFEPFFQPQFDAQTGALAGVETLVRWRHPTRGIMTPDAFLPVATQLSVVDAIDRIVLNKGLAAVRNLGAVGHTVPKISFNVVASRLEDPELPFHAGIDELEHTIIAFEVLESVLVEEQSNLFKFYIDMLKERGFHLEVDDFGSGHASIIGLMHLAPNTMKIDQRLIFPLTRSASAKQMVGAIIEIGKALDIKITAEGVETAAHAEILAAMGCDTLQGYYFAKPMSERDLAAFLDQEWEWEMAVTAS